MTGWESLGLSLVPAADWGVFIPSYPQMGFISGGIFWPQGLLLVLLLWDTVIVPSLLCLLWPLSFLGKGKLWWN